MVKSVFTKVSRIDHLGTMKVVVVEAFQSGPTWWADQLTATSMANKISYYQILNLNAFLLHHVSQNLHRIFHILSWPKAVEINFKYTKRYSLDERSKNDT